MSYTFTEHTADGTQVTFPFRFSGSDKGYLRASDILVEILENGVWSDSKNWSLSGTHQITFVRAPTSGTKIRIRRVVDKERNFAEFDRNVVLDMKSLNGSFTHLLEISQEIIDGFFPAGYFIKQNVDWGGNKIVNLGAGTAPGDAVNKGQLDEIDKKHTEWNTKQDMVLEGLKSGMTSGVAHRTVPWVFVASGGETKVKPPYTFADALVFINGVLQYELNKAIEIKDSTIIFAEELMQGDEVLILVGSRIAAAEPGLAEANFNIREGTQRVDIGSDFSKIAVFLDGLRQPSTSFRIDGRSLVFSEPLPACSLSAILVTS